MFYGILFLILAVALVVGPIMLMKPSGRQLQLTKLRQQAMNIGLSTSIQNLPKGLNSRYPNQLAVYQRAFKGEKLKAQEATLLRLDFDHELHYCGPWAWRGGKSLDLPLSKGLRQALDDLDASVIGIEINRLGIGLMWLEKSTNVEELAHFIDVVYEELLRNGLLQTGEKIN